MKGWSQGLKRASGRHSHSLIIGGALIIATILISFACAGPFHLLFPMFSAPQKADMLLEPETDTVVAGQTFSYHCAITNTGGEPLTDLLVQDDQGKVGSLDALKPGETCRFRGTVRNPSRSRIVDVRAFAAGKRLCSGQVHLDVVEAPSDPSLTAVLEAVEAGQPGSGNRYRVSNQGSAPLTRVQVTDSRGQVLGILPRLDPGEDQVLSTSSISSDIISISAIDPFGRQVSHSLPTSQFEGNSSSAARNRSVVWAGSEDLELHTMSVSEKQAISSGGFISEAPTSGTQTGPQVAFQKGNTSQRSRAGDLNVSTNGSQPMAVDVEDKVYQRGVMARTTLENDAATLLHRENETGFLSKAMGSEPSLRSERGDMQSTPEEGSSQSPDLVLEFRADTRKAHAGESVNYTCTLRNIGTGIYYDVVMVCHGVLRTTEFLSPRQKIEIQGTVSVNGTQDLVATARGNDSSGKTWTNRSELRIWEVYSGITVEAASQPTKAHPGEPIVLSITVHNNGTEKLHDILVTDTLGGGGKIETLESGSSASLQWSKPVDQSLEDEILVLGQGDEGNEVYNSRILEIPVNHLGLELKAEPSSIVAYRGDEVPILWELTNTGEEPLHNINITGDGMGKCRLIEINPGETSRMAANYKARDSGVLSLVARGYYLDREVSDQKEISVNTISPGISLQVMPETIEFAAGETVKLSCLITNSGDDTLRDLVLSEEEHGAIFHLDELRYGEFRVAEPKLVVLGNRTLKFTVTSKDTRGKIWRASASSEATMIKAALDLRLKASPEKLVSGDCCHITCIVENKGSIPLYNIFLISRAFGPLGSIEFLAPKQSRTVSTQVTVTKEVQDVVSVEGFTTTKENIVHRQPLILEVTARSDSLQEKRYSEKRSTTISVNDTSAAKQLYTSLSQDGHGPTAKPTSISIGANTSIITAGGGRSASSPANGAGFSRDQEISLDTGDLMPRGGDISQGTIGDETLEYGSEVPDQPLYITSENRSEAPSIPESADPLLEGLSQGSEEGSKSSGNRYMDGISRMIGYILGLFGDRANEKNAALDEEMDEGDEYQPGQGLDPSMDIPLGVEMVRYPRPFLRILDVTAIPPEPKSGEAVKVLVHAEADGDIESAVLDWGMADPTQGIDVLNVQKTAKSTLNLEAGSASKGYWSATIPGQRAGTYIAVTVRMRKDNSLAEDGPYLIQWTGGNETRRRPLPLDVPTSSSEKGRSMLYIESSSVSGRGEISIRDTFLESAVNYEQDLQGQGTIDMETQRCVDKSNPVVNFSESNQLLFDGGILKGFKRFSSPVFHGGMGASITERFNTSYLDRSERGMIRSYNYRNNTVAFSTEQAFEGIFNTRTEYARYNKKFKADQKYNGSFQTQRNIKFQD